MQTTMLPKSICDDIDRRCRELIWGDTSDHQKHIHLVSWDKICVPKEVGGLCIRSWDKICQSC